MTDTLAPRWGWLTNSRLAWSLLICSLALNLLFVGTMMGQKLRQNQPGLPPGIAARLAQDSTAGLVAQLSEAKRTQVRAIFESHRGQNRSLWVSVRERRAEVNKLLDAEPFNQTAYVAAMTRLIDTEAKARTAAQGTFAEVAAVLSPKERQDFLVTHRQLRQQILGPQRDSRRERPSVDGSGQNPPRKLP